MYTIDHNFNKGHNTNIEQHGINRIIHQIVFFFCEKQLLHPCPVAEYDISYIFEAFQEAILWQDIMYYSSNISFR